VVRKKRKKERAEREKREKILGIELRHFLTTIVIFYLCILVKYQQSFQMLLLMRFVGRQE